MLITISLIFMIASVILLAVAGGMGEAVSKKKTKQLLEGIAFPFAIAGSIMFTVWIKSVSRHDSTGIAGTIFIAMAIIVAQIGLGSLIGRIILKAKKHEPQRSDRSGSSSVTAGNSSDTGGNNSASTDSFGSLSVYLDINKLDGGAYGITAGSAVAKVIPASMMENMTVLSGDSNATLYGSANEYVIGIMGRTSELKAIADKLRTDAELTALLSDRGVLLDGEREPLVIDGLVQNGVLVNPPGHSTSLCAAGFNDVWKKAE